MRVAGLIAAAGASTRMGTCKALLPFSNDIVFVQRLAEVFTAAGLDPIIVTLPESEAEASSIEKRLTHLRVTTSQNERPKDGLTGSVITALLHATDVEAIVVVPVDCPFADVSLVQSLLIGLSMGVAAVPLVEGRRGHPVAFARPAFELLWSASSIGGPRGVLEAIAADVIDVPWSDPRICDDIDTPEDYERLFGRKLAAKT